MESDDTGRRSAWAASRLLIVDDDPAFLEVLADILRAGGYSVTLADSAAAALDVVAAAQDIDLLITDLSMPGLDGIALIQRMQQRPQPLPAILLTGLADDGIATTLDALLSGRFAMLRKPVDSRLLLIRIAEMLEGAPHG